MAYSEKYYYDKANELYTPQLNEQLAIINSSAATQTNAAKTLYEGQIAESGREYDDLERQNAVQKLINEREVAENMANLGLTDSGLNRTQQTAVQLSAANNAAKIQRQKQSMVDGLSRELSSLLAQIETDRSASESTLRQNINNAIHSTANTWRQADIDAETERTKAYYDYLNKQSELQAKAEKEASYIIRTDGGLLSRNFQGTLAQNGVSTYKEYKDGVAYNVYVDNNSGKKTTILATINPYTGADNSVLIDMYGAFSNGYQPKGTKKNGKITGSVGTTTINGLEQKVWKAEDGNLLIWNGATNSYNYADINGDGVYNVKDIVAAKKKAAQ